MSPGQSVVLPILFSANKMHVKHRFYSVEFEHRIKLFNRKRLLMNFLRFLKRVAHHWGALVTGGVFIGALGIYQGVGHTVPHWVYWTIAGVAVFLATYRTWLDEYEQVLSLQSKPTIPTQNSITNNPAATATGIGNVIVNFPSTNPPPVHAPALKEDNVPPYNVHLVGRRITWIKNEGMAADYFVETDGRGVGEHRAFVVDFRNEHDPDRRIWDWYDVSASVKYKGGNGKEILSISAGTWVKSELGLVTFQLQQKKSLVVAMKINEDWVTIERERKLLNTAHGSYEEEDVIFHPLPKEKVVAEIVLHDKNGLSFPMGDFEIDFS
jgi:hypothetical protein